MAPLPLVGQPNSSYKVSSQKRNDRFSNEDDGKQCSNKRQHHNPIQIQSMEKFFKDRPYPTENERKSLGQALGLEPSQVKFWFQNKRSQHKSQNQLRESSLLKIENEKLRAENMNFREKMSSICCLSCASIHQDQLALENSKLKKEVETLQNLTKNYGGDSIWNDPQFSAPLVSPRSLDLGSIAYGGQILSNSPEENISASNGHVASSVAPSDHHVTLHQTMEGTFWTPAFINEITKTKKPRLG